MRPRLPQLLLALLALAPLSRADFITGHVVDSNGIPVPGVNINAFRVSNGNEENLQNDGTNANGDFLTTIPPNVYDIHFVPPAPPQTTLVTLVLKNVVVTGTKNLGTVVLPPGVSLSGHVQSQGGVPISQVSLNVIDRVSGDTVILVQKKTDAFGNFNVAVPAHAITLQLDPSGNLLGTFAARSMDLSPAGNTNLGNLVLKNGFAVSGTVVRTSNGSVVPSVDLDFFDTATGEKLYTPNDTSNILGNFSVVVPAANYDIEFCPTFATSLVGKRINRSVAAATALGSIALDTGAILRGKIRSFNGTIQVNADVDVRDQVTQTKVVTCADNSNATGDYAIIVPLSTIKVTFHPPTFDVGLGSDIHKNVSIIGTTVLDGSLPSCPLPNNYGTGLAGTGGIVPHLTTSGGSPVQDNGAFAIQLQNGRGGATAFVMVSLAPAARPQLGGTLLVDPSIGFFAAFPLGGTPGVAGAGSLTIPANLGAAVNLDLYLQAFVQDPGAVQGWAFSEGLHFRVCR